MRQVTFGYAASESILEYDGKTLTGTNPIHDIATDEIIGRINFTYTYKKLWDVQNEKYLAKLDVVILLDSLQDPKNIKANPLLYTSYYYVNEPGSRIPNGSRFKNLLTSVNNVIPDNSSAIINVNQDGYRIYELEF
jgi:hypothetical protein